MDLIDFQKPFILGAFWGMVLVLVLAFVVISVLSARRRMARYDLALDIQERENTANAVKIAALEERAKANDKQREMEQQLATQMLGNEQDRGASFRFRTQGIATVAMALENWLRMALMLLEKHHIPIETPPPWFGKYRHEGDSYPEIEQARVERLQTMINEYKQSIGGLDWELPPDGLGGV